MRKIKSEAEIKQSSKKNKWILGALLLILMVGSIAGFAFMSSPNDTSNQNNIEGIQNIGNQWVMNYNGQRLVFNSGPEDVKNIRVGVYSDFGSYYNKNLYISSNYSFMTTEIAYNLGKFASKVQNACYGQCNEDLPEKTCTDNLIVISYSNTSKVYQQDNCIFIEGNIKAVDAFLYKIFTQ